MAAPVTGDGRVCGTSATSAPSVTASSTPRSRARSGDDLAERPPAIVGLDADEQDRVAVRAGDAGAEEGVLGPFDLAGSSFLERDVRPRRLEVDEELRVDVGELPRSPQLREVARGEGRRLAAVVPAAERADENRTLERRRAFVDAQLPGHRASLLPGQRARRAPESEREREAQRPDRRREGDVHEHEPPRQGVSVLHLADDRLRDEHAQQAAPRSATARGSRGSSDGGASRREARRRRRPPPRERARRRCPRCRARAA